MLLLLPLLTIFSISIIFRFFAFAIALNVICHSGIFSYKQFTCLLFILTYGAVSMGTSRFKNNLARKGIQRAPLPKGSKAHRAERKIGSRNTGGRVSKIKKSSKLEQTKNKLLVMNSPPMLWAQQRFAPFPLYNLLLLMPLHFHFSGCCSSFIHLRNLRFYHRGSRDGGGVSP